MGPEKRSSECEWWMMTRLNAASELWEVSRYSYFKKENKKTHWFWQKSQQLDLIIDHDNYHLTDSVQPSESMTIYSNLVKLHIIFDATKMTSSVKTECKFELYDFNPYEWRLPPYEFGKYSDTVSKEVMIYLMV